MPTATRAPIVIKAPNHFEREFWRLTELQRGQISEILRDFMRDLREILAGLDPFVVQCRLDLQRCVSCAFNAATDSWPGFEPTAYGLLVSFRDNKFFVCHSNQTPKNRSLDIVDMSRLKLCNGFSVLSALKAREVFLAAVRADQRIREIASA